MARPAKPGLDYFPLDTDMFCDMRIRRLIRRCGGEAVAVYTLLLCTVYRSGYYIVADDDLSFMLSEQSGLDEAYILKVIGCCIDIRLFDKTLYDSDRVLTSRAIQERYREVRTLSRRVFSIKEFALISSEETPVIAQESPVNVQEPTVSAQEPPISSEKSTQRKGNKNKSNKTSSDDDGCAPAPDTPTEIEFVGMHPGASAFPAASPSADTHISPPHTSAAPRCSPTDKTSSMPDHQAADPVAASLAWAEANAERLAHESGTHAAAVLHHARQVAESWRMTGEWDRAKPNTHMASAIKARIRRSRDICGDTPPPSSPTARRIAAEREADRRARASRKPIDSRAALQAYLASQGLSPDTRLSQTIQSDN